MDASEDQSPGWYGPLLEERLRDTLSPEEARLISVCVIDVARPGAWLAKGAVKRP